MSAGLTIRDALDLTAICDKPLSCHHVFKFTYIKLSKSPLLGEMVLLVARELEFGPAESFNHMFLVL